TCGRRGAGRSGRPAGRAGGLLAIGDAASGVSVFHFPSGRPRSVSTPTSDTRIASRARPGSQPPRGCPHFGKTPEITSHHVTALGRLDLGHGTRTGIRDRPKAASEA